MAGTIFSAVAAPLIGGAVSSIFGGGGGGGGGGGSKSTGQAGAQAAAQTADPFASQRPQYQQMLSDLMSGKTPFQETAGAKALTQTGMDAESAQMAARGLSSSGAEKAALTKYATGIASQDYNAQISNLMNMSGTGAGSAGQAGQIMANQSASDTTALNTFGSTVGNAVVNTPTVQGWLGNGNGGNTDMTGFSGNTPAAQPWSGSASGASPMQIGGGDVPLTSFGLNF